MAEVAAIVAVIGLGISIDESKRQQRRSEEQRQISAASEAAERARQRRRQVRELRIKTAQAEQAAVNTGVASSSGELSSVGALAGDFAINQGFLNTMQELSSKSLRVSRDMSRSQVRQQTGQAIQQIGMLGISHFGLPGGGSVETDIDDIFNDPNLF